MTFFKNKAWNIFQEICNMQKLSSVIMVVFQMDYSNITFGKSKTLQEFSESYQHLKFQQHFTRWEHTIHQNHHAYLGDESCFTCSIADTVEVALTTKSESRGGYLCCATRSLLPLCPWERTHVLGHGGRKQLNTSRRWKHRYSAVDGDTQLDEMSLDSRQLETAWQV